MARRPWRRAGFVAIAVLVAGNVWSQQPPVASGGMYVEVFVRGDRRDQKVAGQLVSHDEVRLTIKMPSGERELSWDELTPNSAFTVKSRLIDRSLASDWLTLGEWAWQRGIEQQARSAFQQATRLDPALAPRVAAITAQRSGGQTNVPAPEAPPTTGPVVTTEAKDIEGSSPESVAASTPMQPGRTPGKAIVRYVKPTPEEDAAAIDLARKRKADAETALKIKLAEIETPHFLIFTDWDPSEYSFLREQCEGAYRIVARHFNRSPKDNVFVGKLPIYMFAKPESFRRFASEVNEFQLPPTVLGYFVAVDDMGHMAMWKPAIGTGIGAGGNLDEAKRNWGRTLIHEFCHAFVHRYRSNVRVPRWLNEGTAEVISEAVLPTNNYYANARRAALQRVDVSVLFDDSHLPTGAAYPVMMTLVETLANRDRGAFLRYFDAIKDGMEPEDALRRAYNLDYAGLAAEWQRYAKSLR